MNIDAILNTIIFSLLGLVVIVTMIIVMTMMKYKHRITIKDPVNGGKKVEFDKFKVVKKKNGAIWWKLLKNKSMIPPAPNEVIEITKKGRYAVTYYRLNGDCFIPVKDSFDINDYDKTSKLIQEMQPYTTKEREIMVNQHNKALRDRKLKTSELIAQAIPYAAMILLVVCVMLFWGEFMKPMQETLASTQDSYLRVAEKLESVAEKLDDTVNDQQTLRDEKPLNPPSMPDL